MTLRAREKGLHKRHFSSALSALAESLVSSLSPSTLNSVVLTVSTQAHHYTDAFARRVIKNSSLQVAVATNRSFKNSGLFILRLNKPALH